MSVMDMNSRMAMAEKLSVPQLQQAIQSGSLPAYIGIPLIEQKNKERAQMAAAQQGQQKPPSVVASILQQADQQEQQERGIDELPSNLPMMEDEEMGMAGGGIVAFADRGRVNDPYAEDFTPSGTNYTYDYADIRGLLDSEAKLTAEDASMGINLENDPSSYTSEYVSSLANRNQRAEVPSYLRNVSDRVRKEEAAAQAEAVAREGREKRAERERVGLPMADRLNVPGINPFTPQERVNQGVRDEVPNPPDAFKNDPGYDPVPASPAGRFIQDKLTSAKGELSSYVTRDKLIAPYLKAASGLGNATDAEKSAARAMIRRITQMSVPELNALAKQDSPTAVAAVEGTSIPARMQPTATPQVQKFPDEFPEEAASVNAGIAATPGAKLVNPVVPGAPRPAPTGATSAPRTAPQGGVSPSISRQISSVNPGAPASLSAAEDEASKSPRAAAALSMLDKYVAMLEKSGEDVGRQKKEALYMALIQGGLGMMGGTSPNAFANIAAGMLPATQAYQQALAGIRKDDRARLEKLISAGLKKEEFMLKAEEIGVKRDTARMVYDAAMARTGAMGGSSAGADKQARLFAFNAGRELRQVEGDVAKLKNTDEYKEAARVMSMPYDPKKSSPAIKQMRERAQSVINSVNQETTRRVQDARGAVDFYRSEAGLPPLYSGDTGGGAGGKYEVGRKYRDAKGNEAVYKGKDASGKDIWE
jgi:hypothetical protein